MQRKAFTLIELLVVVAIIVVLMAILLPSLYRARQAAISVKCLSNLKQQGVLVYFYANENQGTLPNGKLNAGAAVDTTLWLSVLWPTMYPTIPYPVLDGKYSGLKNTIFGCPLMDRGLDMSDCITRSPDPSQPPYYTADVVRSYGMNYKLGDNDATTCEKLSRVRNPSMNALIADNYNITAMNTYSLARRHPTLATNVLFCDGHGETVNTTAALFNANDIFWGKTTE